MDYEAVIGLETHAELLTQTKMFCGCSTKFGAEANTQTCPVCIGMPGVLPVVNQRAFEHGLKAALALHCVIADATQFDRKNYYYPDLPKNYQVSQNYNNLGTAGHFDVEVDGEVKRIRIHNVHLEEDAGKLIHSEAPKQSCSLVDLNRAGTPLLEIVTEPDMRSTAELEAFMNELRSTLLYLDVSDCKMEEGRLRFEVSVSVREPGAAKLGSRVEVKNVASVKAVVKAAEYEIERQSKLLSRGDTVAMETRLWNDVLGKTERMRSKEETKDYRYFPEPDLVPCNITKRQLDRLQGEIPELPLVRRRRFVREFRLSEYEAGVLIADKRVADYFEECLDDHNSPKAVCNWVINDVLRELNERRIDVREFIVSPSMLVELIRLQEAGEVTMAHAREVFAEMAATGRAAGEIVQAKGLTQISDEDELANIVRQVIDANPKAAADVRDGKKKAVGFLMGQIMRQTKGRASPQVVTELLRKELGA